MNLGGALLAAGLALGSYSLAQFPGTSLPPGLRSTGAAACTPNTAGGGTFANVLGLWHFDNNGTDQSSLAHNISSLAGGANYSTTQSKFGGYSLNIVTTVTSYAAISGSGISITGDFTYEGWMWQNATSSYTGMIGDDAINMGMLANPNIATYAPGLVSIGAAWSIFGAGAWHHVAWVRASSVFHFYYDGNDQGNAASTGTITGIAGWKIGRTYSASYAMPTNSYLDELRISNIARYTANFTPPALAFCNN